MCIYRTWDEKQQQKHALAGSGAAGLGSPRVALSVAESSQLLALLDDVNTLVKHVSIILMDVQ